MSYNVTATVRSNPCDRNAHITGLVTDQNYNGGNVNTLAALYEPASKGLLHVVVGFYKVRVRIEWVAAYGNYVATTEPDATKRDNLLSLPIYYPARTQGSTTVYESCSV